MHRAIRLYETSVGKKVAMAASGVVLLGFVFVHMIGNLKIYQGQAKFDSYAHFLREIGYPALGHGQFLWMFRGMLLLSVGLHMVAALQLYLMSRRARRVRYRVSEDLSFSYASRTMRWGGLIVLAFVVYHVLHFTLGTVHPDFTDSPYRNVVVGFRQWPVSLFYVLAMLALGLHLYHGMWSVTQTLSVRNRTVTRWRRAFAAVFALSVVLGNISVPLSVLAGVVERPAAVASHAAGSPGAAADPRAPARAPRGGP